MKRQSLKFKSIKKRIAMLLAVMMIVMNCMPSFASEIDENTVITAGSDTEESAGAENSTDPVNNDDTEDGADTENDADTVDTADTDNSADTKDSVDTDIEESVSVRKPAMARRNSFTRLGNYFDENGAEWHELNGIVWSISNNDTKLTISPNEARYGDTSYGKIDDSGDPIWQQYKNSITTVQLEKSKLHPTEGINEIGRFAFEDFTNLQSIRIIETVTSINYGSFKNCQKLKSIQIDNDTYFENDEKGSLYKKKTPQGQDTYELLFAPIANEGTLKIDPRTKKIGGYACYNCKNYTGALVISSNVVEIGEQAFDGCSGIEDIIIGERAYGDDVATKCKASLTDVGQKCFANCSALKNLWIPTSITTKFYQSTNPFENCGYLTNIYLYAVSSYYNTDERMAQKSADLGISIEKKAEIGLGNTVVTLIPWNNCLVNFTSGISTKEKLLPVCVPYDTSFNEDGETLYRPQNGSETVDYRFLWWYKYGNENRKFNETDKVTGDLDLTAKWAAYFKYTFDAGEGDFRTKDYSSNDTKHAYRTVSSGSILAEDDWPADPVKDNALFIGWIAGDEVNQQIVVSNKPNPYVSTTFDQFTRSEYPFPPDNITFTALYYNYKTVLFYGPDGNSLGESVQDWLDLEINEYPSQNAIDHLDSLVQDYWTNHYNSDTNWDFQGWYSGLNGNGKAFDPYSPVPSDVARQYNMYFKHFLTMSYYLHYDKDGDSVDDVITYDGKTNNIYANKAYTLITPPARSGYKFDGWWDKTGTKRYDSTLRYYEVTDDMEFHAHWKKLCKVTLHRNYEQIYSEDYLNKRENKHLKDPHIIYDVVSGSSIMYDSMIPSDTVSNNWKFDGWYIDGQFDDESKKIEKNTPITDDIDVYAKWVDGGCSVVYWATTNIIEDGRYLKNEVWGKIVTAGTKIPIPSSEYNPDPDECEYFGYRFGGWMNEAGELVIDENGNLVDDRYKTINSDTDFYSNWIDNGGPYVKQVQVTFDTMEGPEMTQPGTIDINTPIARPEDPVWEGHKIAGWYTTPDFKTEWDFSDPVEEDMTLYAKWIVWTEEDEDNSHGIYWIKMLKGGKAAAAKYFRESGLSYSYDRSVIRFNKKSRLVKGKHEGETLITATKVDGSPYEASVRVFVYKQELRNMRARNTSTTIDAAKYLTVSGFLPDRWQSTKPSVASIDPKTGLIKVRSRGSTKIKAYYGNKACTATLRCEVPKFSKPFYRMRTGQSKKLTIKKVNKYDIVSWNVISVNDASSNYVSSNSPSYNSLISDGVIGVGTAEIDYNGRITALTAGDVIVEATVYGQTISCRVHIEPPVLKKRSIVMEINKTKRIKLSRTKLKYVEWTSSNDNVAYVDPVSGKIYGLKNGSATLRTTAGGVINTCTVRVRDSEIRTGGNEEGAWGN